MKIRFALALLLGLSLVSLWGCSGGEEPKTSTTRSSSDEIVIAVIPKGTTHEFWKTVQAGAKKAEAELKGQGMNVRIVWKGPLKENDFTSQIELVEQFVNQGVSGIVLAPLDFKSLVPPVQQANAKGIPVVIFDSPLDGTPGKDFVSLVATDNKKGGQMGGEKLAELLGGKGDVVLLRYHTGSASTEQREAGFLEAAAAKGLNIISKDQSTDSTADDALRQSENLMPKLQTAQGVFTPNEPTTYGMLQALRNKGVAGKIKFVGFDGSDKLVEGLEKGEIDALVLQSPFRMGYLAVKTMAAKIKGDKVDDRVDTGVTVVTKADLDKPEIKELIHPDLSSLK